MHAHPEGIRTKGRDGQDEAVERGGLEQIFSSVNRCLPDRTDMEIDGTKKVGEREGTSPSARTRPGQVTTLVARRRDEPDDGPGAAGPRHYD